MLSEKALILAKVEAVYGTDPVPTPAADAVLVINPEVSVEAEKIERSMVRPTLSPVPHLIGKKHVSVSFATELKGSGSLGSVPEISPLLQACGLSEAINAGLDVQYSLSSSSLKSCTIYLYLDGIMHQVNGCRGSFEIVAEAGEQPRISWKFQGLYQIPLDADIPAGFSYESTKGPVFQGATFTWDTYAAMIQKLSLNLNNKFAQREVVSASHGVEAIEIVGRLPGGSINPEAVKEAARPFWANWEAGNGATLQTVIGTAAGNIIQIDSAANGCVKESISWGDRNGIRVYEIPFGLYSESGDDELKLTFK